VAWVEGAGAGGVGAAVGVAVTVRGMVQFEGLNVRAPFDTVPSDGSELASENVTLAAGWLVSFTLKVAIPPASVVVSPVTGVIAKPAASLSTLVSATVAGLMRCE